jgi:hypothetical protein
MAGRPWYTPLSTTRADIVGFALSILFSSEVGARKRADIERDATRRWPFVRLPDARRDRYPGHVELAAPELTEYLFDRHEDYERAVERTGIWEEEVPGWSARFPEVGFAFIEAECVGGTCLYSGFVCRDGAVGMKVDGGAEGHVALLAAVGVRLPGRHFVPFVRGYFQRQGRPDPRHPVSV